MRYEGEGGKVRVRRIAVGRLLSRGKLDLNVKCVRVQ